MSSINFLEEIKTMRFNDIKSCVRGFISLKDVSSYESDYELIYQILSEDHRKNVRALGETVKKHVEHHKSEYIRVKKLYDFDKSYGYDIVAGVDEVGRGPLAGPIVAAAVILDNNSKDLILRINDSKKLTKEVREELSDIIKNEAVSYSIALKTNKEIDKEGIGFCNNEIFKVASVSIASASIIAKVYRDNIMEEYSEKYTQYHFDKNVGYGTKEHIDAIINHGSCSIHRESFLKNIINK